MTTPEKKHEAAAQSLKELCESCDDKEEGKFYCVNCEQVLCDKCKQIHKRNKRLKNDKVIDLINASFRKQTKALNGTCNEHPGKEKEFHCVECQQDMCSFCTSSTHGGHACKHIDYIAEEIKSSFPEKLKHLRDILTKLHATEIKFKSSYGTHVSYLDSLHCEILQQYRIIVDTSKAAYDQQMDKVQELKSTAIDSRKSVQSALKIKIMDIQSVIQSFENDLEYLPPRLINRLHKKSIHILQQSSLPNEVNIPETPSYHKHPLDSTLIQSMVGILEMNIDSVTPKEQTDNCNGVEATCVVSDTSGDNVNKANVKDKPTSLDMSIIRTQNIETIGTFLPIKGGKYVWIAYLDDQFLTRLSMDGRELNTSDNIGGRVADMVLTSTEEVLCTAVGHHRIYRVRKDGVVSCYCSLGPFVATGICITDTDDIYTCLVMFMHSEVTESKISRINAKGEIICTIMYKNGSTKRLFDRENRIACGSSGRLYVIDRWNICNKLVCFDTKYKVVYTWPSKNVTSSLGNIQLTGVACSAKYDGKVYVCDHSNCKVYEVPYNGQNHRVVFDGKKKEIPYSIRIDENDHLLIGCKGRILITTLKLPKASFV